MKRHIAATIISTVGACASVYYHLVLAVDGGALYEFDVALTTGFKADHPVVEIILFAVVLSVVMAAVDRIIAGRSHVKLTFVYCVATVVLLQLAHVWMDHDKRWPLLQNWTHPKVSGESSLYGIMPTLVFVAGLASIGSYIGPWLMLVYEDARTAKKVKHKKG